MKKIIFILMMFVAVSCGTSKEQKMHYLALIAFPNAGSGGEWIDFGGCYDVTPSNLSTTKEENFNKYKEWEDKLPADMIPYCYYDTYYQLTNVLSDYETIKEQRTQDGLYMPTEITELFFERHIGNQKQYGRIYAIFDEDGMPIKAWDYWGYGIYWYSCKDLFI